GVDEALIKVADSYIQLLTPFRDDSPLAKFMEKNGEGIHHVGYRVDDCAKVLEQVKERGARVVDEHPRTGSRGTTVAFLHPRTGSLWTSESGPGPPAWPWPRPRAGSSASTRARQCSRRSRRLPMSVESTTRKSAAGGPTWRPRCRTPTRSSATTSSTTWPTW